MADASNLHKYTGVQKFTDTQGGYFLWIPVGWKQIKMNGSEGSYLFTPDEDQVVTVFTSAKRKLDFKVKRDDLPVLKDGFLTGVNMLPEVEIEKVSETITDEMFGIEAKFSFKEDGQTRVRWMRLIYSGNSLLILAAQGATPEEYERYQPIFFNIMMSTTFI